jgi:hypothetical protein
MQSCNGRQVVMSALEALVLAGKGLNAFSVLLFCNINLLLLFLLFLDVMDFLAISCVLHYSALERFEATRVVYGFPLVNGPEGQLTTM